MPQSREVERSYVLAWGDLGGSVGRRNGASDTVEFGNASEMHQFQEKKVIGWIREVFESHKDNFAINSLMYSINSH